MRVVSHGEGEGHRWRGRGTDHKAGIGLSEVDASGVKVCTLIKSRDNDTGTQDNASLDVFTSYQPLMQRWDTKWEVLTAPYTASRIVSDGVQRWTKG